MSALWILLGLVVLQRVAELVLARRNTARLLAQGGVEHGRSHYPVIVGLHAVWLLTMAVGIPPDAPLSTPWLVLFVLLQAGRAWVIRTLGPYWTTRIISIPDAPLVRRGPYKFIRHPNYLVVALEIFVLPMVFGAVEIAVIFFCVNAVILWHRIRIENAALETRQSN